MIISIRIIVSRYIVSLVSILASNWKTILYKFKMFIIKILMCVINYIYIFARAIYKVPHLGRF